MLIVGSASISLEAPAVLGGAFGPRLSVVLPAWPGRRCIGSFDLLQEPASPFRDCVVPRELFDTTVRRCVEEDLVCVKDLPSIRA
jgi:hypothetical protein